MPAILGGTVMTPRLIIARAILVAVPVAWRAP